MRKFRDEMKFGAVLAWRVPLEVSDLVRLAENAARKDATSFETARYVYELATESNGRRKFRSADIGAVIGKSSSHVRTLVHLYRCLPDEVRKAWAADRVGRLTFARLSELARLAQNDDPAVLQAAIAKIFGVAPASSKPAFEIPIPTYDDEAKPHRAYGLSRKRAAKLAARLELGDILNDDDRAGMVRTILRSAAGLESWRATEAIVDEILSWLVGPNGVHPNHTKEETKHEPEPEQQQGSGDDRASISSARDHSVRVS